MPPPPPGPSIVAALGPLPSASEGMASTASASSRISRLIAGSCRSVYTARGRAVPEATGTTGFSTMVKPDLSLDDSVHGVLVTRHEEEPRRMVANIRDIQRA